MTPWTADLALRGAGGEPVGLARTLLSHGVAGLPPNAIAEDGTSMATTLLVDGTAHAVTLTAGPSPETARLTSDGDRTRIEAQVRRMLRLDEDLSGFYAVAAAHDELAWVVAEGAGRWVQSPTVFEDVVKTICTTNCTWSATERMVGAIVGTLGTAVDGAPDRIAFPTPAQMAAAGEGFYRDVARAGYRGAFLIALATEVAEGRLDLEALTDPDLPDAEAAERLLALPGVGPYAMAHVMMLLGRYRRLILDSWTRPTYRRLAGRPRVTDKGITRAFRPYREYAGLAFWLYLTRGWVGQDG